MRVPSFIEFDVVKYFYDNLPVAGHGKPRINFSGNFTMSEHRVRAIKYIVDIWNLVYKDTDTKVHFIPYGESIPDITKRDVRNYQLHEHRGNGYGLIVCIDYDDNENSTDPRPCFSIDESDFVMHSASFINKSDKEREKRNFIFFKMVKNYIESMSDLLYPEGYYCRDDKSNNDYDYVMMRSYMYHPQTSYRSYRYVINGDIVSEFVLDKL